MVDEWENGVTCCYVIWSKDYHKTVCIDHMYFLLTLHNLRVKPNFINLLLLCVWLILI